MKPALLTDFDGVLRQWPRHDRELEEEHGLPPGALRREAFEKSLLTRVITGAMTDQEWRRTVTERLSRLYPGCRASEAVARWSAPAGTVDEEVLRILSAAREHATLVLVTNATDRLGRDLAALGLSTAFDAIVNSSEVGAAKPDPAFFEHALAVAGCSPEQALLVDDAPAHVEAGVRLGIRSLLFTGASSLRGFLKAHLGLPS